MIKETIDAVRVAEMEAEKQIQVAKDNAAGRKAELDSMKAQLRKEKLTKAQEEAKKAMDEVVSECRDYDLDSVMLDGKKGVAQKIVYEAFSMIQEKTGNDPLETFEKAMENIMPSLECKTRRVGGANYQVPLEVSPARRETLGLRWLTAYSRTRGEKTMAQRLAAEIMDAANNTGNAVKKREDTHKMAEANKAFAHFRY